MILGTMPNGASVADWLGTAMTAANIGGAITADVRREKLPLEALREAEEYLSQALSEVRAVRAEVRA